MLSVGCCTEAITLPAPCTPIPMKAIPEPPSLEPAASSPRATDCCMNELPLEPDNASAFLTSLNKALVSSSYSIACIATFTISNPRSAFQL